jgi:hypothetical protein
LSAKPPAILARVFADKGAIKRMSAHFIRSMCGMGSPFSFQ